MPVPPSAPGSIDRGAVAYSAAVTHAPLSGIDADIVSALAAMRTPLAEARGASVSYRVWVEDRK